MDVSIFATFLYRSKLPNSASGLVAITYDNAMLNTACPKNTFLSHPRNTARRSIARSFSFLVILVRIVSASSPPPPASQSSVVNGVDVFSSSLSLLGRVAPVSVASSLRRLYKSLSRLTTFEYAFSIFFGL